MYPIERLDVRIIWSNQGRLFHNLQPITYVDKVIEEGFICDGPSIPRIVQHILPKTDDYLPQAFGHDHDLYIDSYTWNSANRRFAKALKTGGVVWWKRKLLTIGVRIGKWMDYLRWAISFGQGGNHVHNTLVYKEEFQ